MTPIYEHDCEKCTFLGVGRIKDVTYDFYHCMQGGKMPTILARFGKDADYISGIPSPDLMISHIINKGANGEYVSPLEVGFVLAYANGYKL